MASITSLMNSNYNTSSIYGTRNVLSGLASGMDTETMIENAVSGIKKKIQGLLQKRTMVEWQQEAYRSIIDKAVNLNTKYTSYTSKTNLFSSSFFNNAVLTTVNGTYADKISASGKTSSDIKINAVKQLATAASYTVSGSAAFGGDVSTITGGSAVDLSENMKVSTISGSLTLQYGGANGTSFSLDFDELDAYDDAEDLAKAIREQLGEQTWTYTKNGMQETVKGSDVVNVQVDKDGNIKFSDKANNGNSVYISSASGSIEGTLNVKTGSGKDTLKVGSTSLSKSMSTRDYLSDKTLTVSLNGTSKTISMSDVFDKIGDNDATQNARFVAALQEELDKAFGANKVKADRGQDGVMSFKAVENGSTLTLGGSAVKALGFESGDSNYINTGKTLKDLLGEDSKAFANSRLRGTFRNYDGTPTEKTTSNGVKYYVDDAGNRVDKDGYRITDTGEAIYDFEINGAHIQATGDTTLESLMNSINANVEAGVKVSYSKLTNEFKFTATKTGANSKIEFGGLAAEVFNPPNGSLSDSFFDSYGINVADSDSAKITFTLNDASKLSVSLGYDFEDGGNKNLTMKDIVDDLNSSYFKNQGYTAAYDAQTGRILISDKNGDPVDFKITTTDENGESVEHTPVNSVSSYTAGTDAVMDVEVNGVRFENLTRSSNSFDIDGMTINVKGTFGVDESGALTSVDKDGNDIEPITFTTVTDTETIVDAIRSFVNDYNEMVTELKGAYSTQPKYDSSNNRYQPLTAEQEAEYSESELEAYNEKAKQGILFGDTTLSSFYSKVLNAVAPGGVDGQTLRELGIGTSYSNGLTTISLDEDKLRTALESDPDKVKNAFTKTVENGSSSNGLMQNLQNTLNTYTRTTGEPKGVLITRAGSVKAPTSLNNNSLNTQINNIDKQITRWQDKMSAQIDRYTTQFSKLEQLIAEMNSQSSALAGLMGGYDSY